MTHTEQSAGHPVTFAAIGAVILAWLAFLVVADASQQSRSSKYGSNADLAGYRPFTESNPWNRRVDNDPVDPASDRIIASIGADKPLHPDFAANWNGGPSGIPYVVVPSNQPRVPVVFDYAEESDPGPYPIPNDPPIEGGGGERGDRHVLIVDRDKQMLYELFAVRKDVNGWRAGSGAIFDMSSDKNRTAGWTSADAAGLPIFPGLARFDEVARGEIRHALRFTVSRSRRAYVSPARHFASRLTDSSFPPMGMRVRLKSSVDISGFAPDAKVILRCLQQYGMIVADNGGDWYLSGAPDVRWNDKTVNTLKRIKGKDFEVLKMGELITR